MQLDLFEQIPLNDIAVVKRRNEGSLVHVVDVYNGSSPKVTVLRVCNLYDASPEDTQYVLINCWYTGPLSGSTKQAFLDRMEAAQTEGYPIARCLLRKNLVSVTFYNGELTRLCLPSLRGGTREDAE